MENNISDYLLIISYAAGFITGALLHELVTRKKVRPVGRPKKVVSKIPSIFTSKPLC